MKTELLNVPFSLEARYGRKMKSFGAVTEPLGLAYLAGSLERAGFPVAITDAPALGMDMEGVIHRLQSSRAELVGITFLTPMFDIVQEVATRLKALAPEVLIIVGGPHPSALPERTLKEIPALDFACIGEGENLIVALVDRLARGAPLDDLSGLVRRENGLIIRQDPGPPLRNLDDLAKPARHLLPMNAYRLTASRTKGSDLCPTVIVARGCPFKCSFCSHPFGRTFRHHSVERILEELRELKEGLEIDQVNLEADTLTINRRFITDLCEGLIGSGLDLTWTCESRVDTVDEETLRLMKRAGCWQISYGVETGSERLMDEIQKGVSLDQVRRVFRITKEVGISIRGFFMIGLPGERSHESRSTIDFAKELDPYWAQFTLTVPYPGTPMFDRLKEEGSLRHFNWADYNTWGGWAGNSLPYVPPDRTEDEIKSFQKRAMRDFYLRPAVFLRFARTVTTAADLKKYIRGFLPLLRSRL